MQAYKCDECGEFKEGDAEDIHKMEMMGKYEVAFAVAIVTEKAEADSEPELESDLLRDLYRIGFPDKSTNKRKADLCRDCAIGLARQSMLGERVST